LTRLTEPEDVGFRRNEQRDKASYE